MNKDEDIREEAKKHILKTKRAMKEFPNYPKNWLNKLISFRYNITDPVSKQIDDYCKYENKNVLRKDEKFDTIVYNKVVKHNSKNK